MVNKKKKIVVLSGAGISAESGLKTFRDSDGLWEGYRIEDVATPEAWIKNPGLVLDFYNERRKNVKQASPNIAHIKLAALEEDFNVTVITQNVDDLHERAGSTDVLHLHGEILKMRSERNASFVYPIKEDIRIGDKAEDGYQLRPHIVWFGEEVPAMETALPIVHAADIFVVIGTSLAVYPAAGLVNYTKDGIPKFIIDKKIPAISGSTGVTLIEKNATEGILDLVNFLS